MNIILLSGGSSERLWPMSGEKENKQFLQLFGCNNMPESMLQRTYRLLQNRKHSVVIASLQSQVPEIKRQIGEDAEISVEPCRRNSFPAIALASAYLKDVKGVSEDETVIVLPVDSFAGEDYFDCLEEFDTKLREGGSKLVLMGIKPLYPSGDYGYILTDGEGRACGFREKPDEDTAAEYIKSGALWNGGIFGFKLGYVLKKAEEKLGTAVYAELLKNYESLPKISFDYAVSEHEDKLGIVKYTGEWEDVGTWNRLAGVVDKDLVGNGVVGDCENVTVVNTLAVPVLAVGLKDVVIAAGSKGIIIMDRKTKHDISRYAEQLKNEK